MSENPFYFEAAHTLDPEIVLEYYISDRNYSRLLESARNIFLLGERGCGKSMTLLFHSLRVQTLRKQISEEERVRYIGVYVPCNNTLFLNSDWEIFNEFHARLICEHQIVVGLLESLFIELGRLETKLDEKEADEFLSDIEYLFDEQFTERERPFYQLQNWVTRSSRRFQQALNQASLTSLQGLESFTFADTVIPILRRIRDLDMLNGAHFSFLIDDYHMLNPVQVRIINSLIAHRDHSLFSFKIASTKVDQPPSFTITGGVILQGHDYSVVDMEFPYLFEHSDFANYARDIITKRLSRIGLSCSPEEFFPINSKWQEDLNLAKEAVRRDAVEVVGLTDAKKINDYVYKRYRARYFRDRGVGANLPPYSGFEIVTYISTGIVRNLLEPCFYMYDAALGELGDKFSEVGDGNWCVSPEIQKNVILALSENLWYVLEKKLPEKIEGCTNGDAQRLFKLLDGLADLFRDRLLTHESEPSALSFSISQRNDIVMKELDEVITLGQRANYIFLRMGPAKKAGQREVYYVPNRLLWPARGLDPKGQAPRVSIPAKRLLAVANGQESFPTSEKGDQEFELDLFDEQT